MPTLDYEDARKKPRVSILEKPLKWKDVAVALLILSALWASVLLIFEYIVSRVPPQPNAIILAMLPPPRKQAPCEQRKIIRAIRAYGNVNGSSGRTSFLAMAVLQGKHEVVEWLLSHGANPNPPGEQPLFAAIRNQDWLTARALVKAGASWSGQAWSGMTIREWVQQNYPQLPSDLEKQMFADP